MFLSFSMLTVLTKIVLAAETLDFKLVETWKILPTNNIPTLYGNLGYVKEARPCGGPGKFVRWRYEPCESSTLCVIPPEKTYRGEIVFIPSANTTSISLDTVFKNLSDGDVIADTRFIKLNADAIQAGKEYGLFVAAKYPSSLKGKKFNLRLSMIRDDDKKLEVCAEVDYFVG